MPSAQCSAKSRRTRSLRDQHHWAKVMHRSEGEEPRQERVDGHVPAHGRSLAAEPGRYRLPSSALSALGLSRRVQYDGRACARPPDDSRDGGLRVFYTLPGFSMYCMFSSWIR